MLIDLLIKKNHTGIPQLQSPWGFIVNICIAYRPTGYNPKLYIDLKTCHNIDQATDMYPLFFDDIGFYI